MSASTGIFSDPSRNLANVEPFTAAQTAVLDTIKTGASSSWIMSSTALIFFMQLGFIMVEASAAKRHHWGGIAVKNFLDIITGAIAWWVVGFGLAFGPTDSRGFIGLADNTFSFSAGFRQYSSEDLYLKWIFQFAFASTASAIVSGLLMERSRIETYGAFSFLMSFFIYPIVACWEWNSTGWLALRGFKDFAGCGPIHTLGGICGLVGGLICGTRYNRFTDIQFPFFFPESRRAKLQEFNREALEKIKKLEELDEIKELVEEGRLTKSDVRGIKEYSIRQFYKPDLDLEDESPMFLSIGLFILWLGWFFFNGGSAYGLYNSTLLPSKIIANTILGAGSAGATVYFVKKPISLWVCGCFRKKDEYYKTFRKSQRFDAGSVSNGILAGLVAITAGCDVVEPWAAISIGVIAGFVYSFFSKFMLAMNVDDPLEAASVHYANGVWGVLSVIIFDQYKGFVSGNPIMGEYLGVQVYGIICITLWGIFWSSLFFGVCSYFGVARYHPVLEFVGVHRIKMGEISEKWLSEIRAIANEKAQHDVEANKIGEVLDYDAQGDSNEAKEGKAQNVPSARNSVKPLTETQTALF